MDPSRSACLWFLDSVEAELSVKDVWFTEKFELRSNADSKGLLLLSAFKSLTLKDTVNPETLISTEGNRPGPGMAAFEEDLFEITVHEGDLKRIT